MWPQRRRDMRTDPNSQDQAGMVGSHQLRRDCMEVGAHRKLLAGDTLRTLGARKPEEAVVGLSPWSEEDA